ncbi:Centrosomal protein [Chlorella vulgaris]
MQSAEAGSPVPLLPALDYLLLHFSTHVVQRLAELGLQLHGLSDLRFVEGAFKFARGLGMRLALTPAQFLCQGYAERKVQLVHGIVKACRELHNAAARKERLASVKGQHRVRMYNSKQASPRPATQDLLQAQSMDQAVPPNGKQHSRSGALAAPVLPHPGALSLRFKPVADAAACCEGEEHAVLKPDPRLQQHEQQLSATEAEAAELQQASGAEQPRPLPPPLAVLPLPPQVARQEGRKQVAPVSIKCSLPALSYPQLTAAGGPAQLTLPVQSEQQVHRGAAGTQMPGFSWQAAQQASLAQHAAQPQQQGLAACTADPPPQKGALASAQQMQQEDEKQLQASYGTKQQQQQQQQQQEQQQQQQQAWLLTSELQARLRLAEEAAASARHEAEQAREQLQARVTLLEGRMRFLEAGYELRPLQQQQQWERKTQRQQLQRPFPALPAAPGMRSSLADCSVGWDGQKGLDMAPEELHMPLRPAAAAAGPLLPSWEEQADVFTCTQPSADPATAAQDDDPSLCSSLKPGAECEAHGDECAICDAPLLKSKCYEPAAAEKLPAVVFKCKYPPHTADRSDA